MHVTATPTKSNKIPVRITADSIKIAGTKLNLSIDVVDIYEKNIDSKNVTINIVRNHFIASLLGFFSFFGGKALGKSFAKNKCTSIIYAVAKILSIFEK